MTRSGSGPPCAASHRMQGNRAEAISGVRGGGAFAPRGDGRRAADVSECSRAGLFPARGAKLLDPAAGPARSYASPLAWPGLPDMSGTARARACERRGSLQSCAARPEMFRLRCKSVTRHRNLILARRQSHSHRGPRRPRPACGPAKAGCRLQPTCGAWAAGRGGWGEGALCRCCSRTSPSAPNRSASTLAEGLESSCRFVYPTSPHQGGSPAPPPP